MPNIRTPRLNLRVTGQQLEQYTKAAAASGQLLHDWSRRVLDRAAVEATKEQRPNAA